jgi:hypothetical protein
MAVEAEAADIAKRAADAQIITNKAKRLQAAFAKLDACGPECREAARDAAVDFPDLVGLAGWAETVLTGSPDAVEFGVQVMLDRARDIVAKRAPLLAKAPPPFVLAKEVEIETVLCFVLNPIAFADPRTGQRARAARGSNVQLSPDQVTKAITIGAVAKYDHRDPRVKAFG